MNTSETPHIRSLSGLNALIEICVISPSHRRSFQRIGFFRDEIRLQAGLHIDLATGTVVVERVHGEDCPPCAVVDHVHTRMGFHAQTNKIPRLICEPLHFNSDAEFERFTSELARDGQQWTPIATSIAHTIRTAAA
jgi:hypothetical protein